MKFEVLLPGLGEDTTDVVTVSSWLAKIGDELRQGDDLLEITTDKAAFSLPAPKDGILSELLVHDGDEINVGDTVCMFEVQA